MEVVVLTPQHTNYPYHILYITLLSAVHFYGYHTQSSSFLSATASPVSRRPARPRCRRAQHARPQDHPFFLHLTAQFRCCVLAHPPLPPRLFFSPAHPARAVGPTSHVSPAFAPHAGALPLSLPPVSPRMGRPSDHAPARAPAQALIIRFVVA
uniref:Uncharacterized protein n=1 Tax=Heliothis virescens TaxID=7102 RepID=A0A2A4JN05_HELVI